jgi:hypothetical protein
LGPGSGEHPAAQLRRRREHLAALRRTAEAEPVGELVDRAIADGLRGRGTWRRLLELAYRRRVDAAVVWMLDRVLRSVPDGATTLQALRAAGSGRCSLREPWIGIKKTIGEATYRITIARA